MEVKNYEFDSHNLYEKPCSYYSTDTSMVLLTGTSVGRIYNVAGDSCYARHKLIN